MIDRLPAPASIPENKLKASSRPSLCAFRVDFIIPPLLASNLVSYTDGCFRASYGAALQMIHEQSHLLDYLVTDTFDGLVKCLADNVEQ